MLLGYFTGLIYCQHELTLLLPYFSLYNHILDALVSPNHTQRNIIIYEEIKSKMKIIDEVYLSINDRISVRTSTVPDEKIWRQIVQDLIRSYPYTIFCTILSQDPTISYVFVFLKISSDSDCKMSAQNLTRFKDQETYRNGLNDSC